MIPRLFRYYSNMNQEVTVESETSVKTPQAILHGEQITTLPEDLYIPPDALEVILGRRGWCAHEVQLVVFVLPRHFKAKDDGGPEYSWIKRRMYVNGRNGGCDIRGWSMIPSQCVR